MNYAQLIDGEIVFAPRKRQSVIDGTSYTVINPPAEMLEANGWEPVIYTEMPDAPEGYHYESTYTENSGEIVQGWELVQDEITEESALIRYANSLTGENDQTLIEAAETMCIKLSEED